jgi:hypothetical protein
MSNRFTPTAGELRLLTEHLFYEVQMTFDLAMLLVSSHVPNVLVRNAMVETFPMHVRQLTEFFWNERSSNPKAERDAFAADYFNPGEWASLRPECPADLDAVWEKVGWGIVHLTYGRANVTPEQKEWRPLEICQALAPVVRCFVENVDPAKLDAEWFDPMRKCIDRFTAFEHRHAGAAA